MADVDLDALEHQVRVANGEVPNICRTFRETAAWGVIPRVPALIAELRRLRGQPQPWMCRTCLTTQPVEDGVVCHYVCESCRVAFERLKGQRVELRAWLVDQHDTVDRSDGTPGPNAYMLVTTFMDEQDWRRVAHEPKEGA